MADQWVKERRVSSQKSYLLISAVMLAGCGLISLGMLTRTLSFTDASRYSEKTRTIPNKHWLIGNNTPNSARFPSVDVVFSADRMGIWGLHSHRGSLLSAKNRLLIAQFSSVGQEKEIFSITRIVNKEYAQRWNHDFLILDIPSELVIAGDSPRKNGYLPSMLKEGLAMKQSYDQLLLLDADVMLNDMTRDITTLLPNDKIIAAIPFFGSTIRSSSTLPSSSAAWNVSGGMTLWNLHHALTPRVQLSWGLSGSLNNDQEALQRALMPYRNEVFWIKEEFRFGVDLDSDAVELPLDNNKKNDGDANTVKTTFQAKTQQARFEASVICKKFQLSCGTQNFSTVTSVSGNPAAEKAHPPLLVVEDGGTRPTALRGGGNTPKNQIDNLVDQTTSVTNTNSYCDPRRNPTWEWRNYSGGTMGNRTTATGRGNNKSKKRAQKRLLIASYSSYGNYARLLELTAPINKAYARRWNHGFLTVQGSTLTFEEQDGDCEPPAKRAMYNKLEILQVALTRKDEFDQLLLLDADAMIYDFNFDISTLIEDDDLDMLAAHRVSQIDPEPRTWNINNGIVLWNLHHEETQAVADDWYTSTAKDLMETGEAHGDQHYLHSVLKIKGRDKYCHGLPNEFFYQKGTVVKHFIRTHANNEWNNTRIDAREMDIETTIENICEAFPKDCEELEYSSYV